MKITKKELFKFCDENNDAINELQSQSDSTDFLLAVLIQQLKDSGVIDEVSPELKPQLKQLDQSVFDGLDEKWRFAAVDKGGAVWVYSGKPDRDCGYWFVKEPVGMSIGRGYDASNWQNSLIERDIAKELLEVDLSSELTGSELCKAMINRGDKIVLCIVRDYEHEDDTYYDAITHCSGNYFESSLSTWSYAIPINNQGEPLTAAEAGL